MAMTLDQWQERLQSHFTQLASARAYSDYRLSALEHDLTDEEFDEIVDLLHVELKNAWKLAARGESRFSKRRHWRADKPTRICYGVTQAARVTGQSLTESFLSVKVSQGMTNSQTCISTRIS